MKTFLLAVCTLFLFGLLACEKAADIASPKNYEKESVSFSYPRNWKVKKDIRKEHHRYIIVNSPGDAVFMAQVYQKNDAVSFDRFVKWFSSKSAEKTPLGIMEESTIIAVVKNTPGRIMKGVKENFTVTFLGLKIPHLREYYTMNSNTEVAFLVTQTTTKDKNKTAPGFDLILSSFGIE